MEDDEVNLYADPEKGEQAYIAQEQEQEAAAPEDEADALEREADELERKQAQTVRATYVPLSPGGGGSGTEARM